jgi:phenylalanyl-tRNA synthetase alpha chain
MADAPATSRLDELRREAEEAIGGAGGAAELEELRVRYLGRKSELTGVLRSIGELPPEQRGPTGQAANEVRRALESQLAERLAELEAAELEHRLVEDRIDVTLPGEPPSSAGALHLVTQTRREMEDIFVGLGFTVVEGPEVEYDYYNFTALNIPPDHPARLLQDTFYLSAGFGGSPRSVESEVVLRTHTSPMQVRAMERQEPPIYIVIPGRVYRRDSDASHTPMFHQLEGLAVDEDITLADLQGVLLEFARAMFGPEREIRLRGGYFPFTEPSVEVDVSCFRCGGSGHLRDGSRDPLCKGSGWIEILGSGMVDPNVFGFVEESGYDPERIQGFAFGMGIDRIALLKHGVPDLRMLFDNDLRLLEQFR